jgi:hypothetical protein
MQSVCAHTQKRIFDEVVARTRIGLPTGLPLHTRVAAGLPFHRVAAGLPFSHSGCRWVAVSTQVAAGLPFTLGLPLGCRSRHSQVADRVCRSYTLRLPMSHSWVAGWFATGISQISHIVH